MSFDRLFKFEQDLAKYTGAPYVVVTDGCTHALEIALRYDQILTCEFSAYTYLSVPMLMHHLHIDYQLKIPTFGIVLVDLNQECIFRDKCNA